MALFPHMKNIIVPAYTHPTHIILTSSDIPCIITIIIIPIAIIIIAFVLSLFVYYPITIMISLSQSWVLDCPLFHPL